MELNKHMREQQGATGSGQVVQAAVTSPWRPSGQMIAIAAAAAFLFKLVLAFRTYGTNDVYGYERFLNWSRYLGVGVYRAAWDLNHPAFILHVLRATGWVAHVTGMPFSFWFRIPGIFADSITLWLVWKILGWRNRTPSIRWALLMLALAPPLILVAGFHGNTDTIMTMFLILSVYLIETDQIAIAGATFALSMSFKIVPLIAIPAIFLYLGNRHRRAMFFAVAGPVLVLLWSPYIFQDPLAIAQKTLGYRSLYGNWGFSFLSTRFLGDQALMNRAYRKIGAYLLLAAIGALSVRMNRMAQKPALFSQIGLIFFFFLAFSNAFGVQYLAWLVPWAVELGSLPVVIYYAASGAFLLAVYNYWSEGFPWYLADSNRIGGHEGHLDYFHLLCWLAVLCICGMAWKQIRTGKPFEPEFIWRMPVLARRGFMILSLLALVAYPTYWQLSRDARPLARLDGDRVLRIIRAQQYSELSSLLYAAERHQEAIASARQALLLDPDDATAYNNIAGSSVALGLWEQAIEGANQALRILPGLPSAQQNLTSGVQGKLKAGGPGH